MPRTASEIRRSLESNWNEYLSKYANLFSSNYVEGSSPPSVFVGSYGYPKVLVGPMVPPMHGNTEVMDLPEAWAGKKLEDIVNYRLSMVRGVQAVKVQEPRGRYVESLQDLVMAERSTPSEVEFVGNAMPSSFADSESAPYGPIGEVKSAKFANSSPNGKIQDMYYDKDVLARDAILELYNDGIEVSKIQKCLSVGMFGRERKLVPTRWSITATDDTISKAIISEMIDLPEIDCCQLFSFQHLGNLYAVILFPGRWMFEMQEAWYDKGGNIGFGSAFEDASGLFHYPETAGAHFASRLAVSEYLADKQIRAGALVLREIRPEYIVPVGVWQVREGVRMALRQKPMIVPSLEEGLEIACGSLSVDKKEWISRSRLFKERRQKSIADFF